MSTTYSQAKSLLEDLKKADRAVAWPVGKVINALLEKAKEEQPDNVALAVMDPLRPGVHEKYW